MDEMVFRSDDVPAADRFDYWVELLGRAHAPMELRSDYADDFRASQRVLELGAVSVWAFTFQPLVFRRVLALHARMAPPLSGFRAPQSGAAVRPAGPAPRLRRRPPQIFFSSWEPNQSSVSWTPGRAKK